MSAILHTALWALLAPVAFSPPDPLQYGPCEYSVAVHNAVLLIPCSFIVDPRYFSGPNPSLILRELDPEMRETGTAVTVTPGYAPEQFDSLLELGFHKSEIGACFVYQDKEGADPSKVVAYEGVMIQIINGSSSLTEGVIANLCAAE